VRLFNQILFFNNFVSEAGKSSSMSTRKLFINVPLHLLIAYGGNLLTSGHALRGAVASTCAAPIGSQLLVFIS